MALKRKYLMEKEKSISEHLKGFLLATTEKHNLIPFVPWRRKQV